MGEAAFKLKEGEVDGVIEYTDPQKGRQYAVIKCEKRTPERQLTYDDVRKSIANDFINYHRKQISQQVTQYLYDNYEVTINEKVLAKAIKSLSDEKKKSSKSSSKKKKWEGFAKQYKIKRENIFLQLLDLIGVCI